MIAYRMIAKLILRSSTSSLALMVLLVLLADFIESARRLLESSSVWNVLIFYACKLPSVTYLAMPVAFVVGTCIVFASLARHGELRALAGSGIGPVDMFKPVLFFGIGVMVFVMVLGEAFVPPATDMMERLMEQHFGRIDPSWRFFRNHQWVKGDSGRLIRVGRNSKDGKTLDYVIAFQTDEKFHVRRRMDARRVLWRDGKWLAQRVEYRRFRDFEQLSFEKMSSAVLDWTEQPDLFCDLSGRPQQKNIIQLLSSVSLLKDKGLNPAEYLLELHRRFAYPLMGVIMVLLLFPCLSAPVSNRSTAGAIVLAMYVVFPGYVVVAFCTTAVSGGLIDPRLGAWVPPALFLIACIPGWWRLIKTA